MFSFRRKPSKKGNDDSAQIHTSPSLPNLSPEGMIWPENLVDLASIRQELPEEPIHQGATKTSFEGVDHAPILFHKPFRGSPGKAANGPISSLYMSNLPAAFEGVRTSTYSAPSRKNQRRVRIPPTFNLMVVGGLGTGKTSLLRLLLETADISPTATVDQRAAMDRFLHGPTRHTQSIQTACVEICESKFDRVLFSVIDTTGLDFLEGHELKLERQVSGIMKYLDTQYADTMSEESKVIRQNKGDAHIHLCIYMIDPSAVLTVAARRARSSVPSKTRSEATISYRPPDLVPDNSDDDSDDEAASNLTMSPAEIRVIRRLSARTNVLPVIARADSLTDEKLAAVKDAVRKGLQDANLGFGVFDPKVLDEPIRKSTDSVNGNTRESVSVNGHGMGNVLEEEESEEENDSDPEERQARPVIKLRPSRHRSARLSRSRSRRDLTDAGVSPDPTDRESVANVRFSAHKIAKTDLTTLLPFALIAPEDVGKLRKRPVSSILSSPVPDMSEDGHNESFQSAPAQLPASPTQHSVRNMNMAYLLGPPDDLKGIFTRRFRWGTVDVLDPNHCDFAALRTAVLSTHLKILKTHTKEVLYEKYRTEKLLARRATRNVSDEERKRLLEDLGL